MTKIRIVERDGVTWADIEEDPKGQWVSDKEWWSEPTERAYFGYEKRLEERLRALNIYLDRKWEHPSVCSDAADEIERLKERCEVYKGQVKWGADKIERLTKENRDMNTTLATGAVEILERDNEIERLQELLRGTGANRYWESRWRDEHALNAELVAALEGLHDWYVEYARINNLFNSDGTPATFHELLIARTALAVKEGK